MSLTLIQDFNQEYVMALIKDAKYFYDGTLTICVITTIDDFKIVETSNVVNIDQYDKIRGRKIAYDKAVNKLFDYAAFLYKNQLKKINQN